MTLNCLCTDCTSIFIVDLAKEYEILSRSCPECGGTRLKLLVSRHFGT